MPRGEKATFFLVANRRYKRDLREAPAGSIVSVRAAAFAGRYRGAKTAGAWLMLVIGIASCAGGVAITLLKWNDS